MKMNTFENTPELLSSYTEKLNEKICLKSVESSKIQAKYYLKKKKSEIIYYCRMRCCGIYCCTVHLSADMNRHSWHIPYCSYSVRSLARDLPLQRTAVWRQNVRKLFYLEFGFALLSESLALKILRLLDIFTVTTPKINILLLENRSYRQS